MPFRGGGFVSSDIITRFDIFYANKDRNVNKIS